MPGLRDLSALEGFWSLRRSIAHANGRSDQFEGTARFHRVGDSLIQEELGTLTIGSQKLEAKQSYIWQNSGSSLDVFFSDNRPFHSIPLMTDAPSATHFCDPDVYDVQYNFSDWPQWSTTWNVKGPRKDYVMRSSYRRS